MILFEGIYAALNFFGLGQTFIDMVRTTYTNFKAVEQTMDISLVK